MNCLRLLQVKVVDWMKGQTCGLCGKSDGEIEQDLQTPNQRQVDNAVSFIHSWVLPAKSCLDASGNTIAASSFALRISFSIQWQNASHQ